MTQRAGDAPPRTERPPPQGGFTLIEVIAALVVFSTAVLMATSLTTALATQTRYSSLRSEIASKAQHKLDSVAVLPYDSVTVGATVTSLAIQGTSYHDTIRVLQFAPRIREVQVRFVPASTSLPGPQYRVVTYLVKPW